MALKTRGLPITHWQEVLPDVLHSIRCLLCTATNSTPHERFFGFERHSSCGGSIPTWLLSPGPVLLKRHVRHRKSDPLVDEVQLLHANPQYAYVQYGDGREATVSIRHLAPSGRVAESRIIHVEDPSVSHPASLTQPAASPPGVSTSTCSSTSTKMSTQPAPSPPGGSTSTGISTSTKMSTTI